MFSTSSASNKKQKTERKSTAAAPAASSAISAGRWSGVPTDLLLQSARWLRLVDLPAVFRTCKGWNSIADKDELWRHLKPLLQSQALGLQLRTAHLEHIQRAFAPQALSTRALLRETLLAEKRDAMEQRLFNAADSLKVDILGHADSSLSSLRSLRITCPAASLYALGCRVDFIDHKQGKAQLFSLFDERPMRVLGSALPEEFDIELSDQPADQPIGTFSFELPLPLVVPEQDLHELVPAGTRVPLSDVITISVQAEYCGADGLEPRRIYSTLVWYNVAHLELQRFAAKNVDVMKRLMDVLVEEF